MMYPRRRTLLPCVLMGLAFLLSGIFHSQLACAQHKWSFAVISDIHSAFSSYQNVLNEIKSPTGAAEERGGIADFVLVLGDMSPVSVNYGIFEKTFGKALPLFLPARGNHENAQDMLFIDGKILNAAASSNHPVTRLAKPGLSYWIDWKNARVIVLDQYADFRKSGASPRALQWLSHAIESAHSADHIFVGFHEPFFPWEAEQDPLWGILLKARPRIRAVFFGHTHVYYRTRFPDLLEGVHAINVGNGGQNTHSDLRQTIVCVSVDGRHARVTTVQTPDGKARFRVSDAFDLVRP